MTYGELKEILDNLTDSQLHMQVRFWGEEEGAMIEELILLEERYVNFGEGFEPESVYENAPDVDPEECDASLPKGTPILCGRIYG